MGDGTCDRPRRVTARGWWTSSATIRGFALLPIQNVLASAGDPVRPIARPAGVPDQIRARPPALIRRGVSRAPASAARAAFMPQAPCTLPPGCAEADAK